MQTTSEHQKARIAAEVAARYGVQVMPDAVQIIPQGVSGFPSYVYQGNQLVAVTNPGTIGGSVKAMKAGAWREMLRKRRVMAAQARQEKATEPPRVSARQPAAEARLAQIRDMAAKGATVNQIAAYLGILVKSASKYCRENGIKAARDIRHDRYETEGRAARYRRALAFGQEAPRTTDDYAEFLGLKSKTAYNYIKARGLPYVHKDRTAKRAEDRAAQRERKAARRAEVDTRREQVAKLHGSGMSIRGIATKLGVTVGAVQRDIKAIGLEAQRRAMGRDELKAEAA